LFHSTDGGSSWETKVDIGGTENNQECCVQYIPSIHSFLVAYKYLPTAAVGSNLTNGQIYTRLFEILGDGSYSAHSAEVIDGGEAEASYQGFVTISASASGASVSWLNDIGSYDALWSNHLL